MNDELIINSAACVASVVELAVETEPAISADDLEALAVKVAKAIKAGVKVLASEGS